MHPSDGWTHPAQLTLGEYWIWIFCIFSTGLCLAAPMTDAVTWTFAADTLPLNLYLVWCSYKFYEKADSQSSRKLFRLSLIHLPALILLMIISKKYPNAEKSELKPLVASTTTADVLWGDQTQIYLILPYVDKHLGDSIAPAQDNCDGLRAAPSPWRLLTDRALTCSDPQLSAGSPRRTLPWFNGNVKYPGHLRPSTNHHGLAWW